MAVRSSYIAPDTTWFQKATTWALGLGYWGGTFTIIYAFFAGW